MTSIEERQRVRANLLNHLFDITEGRFRPQGVFDMADALGLSRDDAADAADYLERAGLIEVHGVSGRDAVVTLTHQGTTEIEAARLHPARPTDHLPAFNTLVVYGNVTNSQIALDSPGAQQSAHWSLGPAEAQDLIGRLRAALEDLPNLDADARRYLEQQLTTAEQHSSRTDDVGRRIVREALATTRSLLEGLAVSGAWYGLTLLPLLPHHGS